MSVINKKYILLLILKPVIKRIHKNKIRGKEGIEILDASFIFTMRRICYF